MISKLVTGILIIFLSNIALAQEGTKPTGESLSREAATLFRDVKTRLTSAEKNKILKDLGFVLSADKHQPFAQDAESLEYPFAARAFPTDMNKDGNEEIFLLYGNSFTSGNTGSSVILFIKDNKGQYQMNLGFPGIPQAMPEGKAGYNDVLIGGPGFTFPVWRWNGKEYAPYKTVKDSELSTMKVLEIEELSKAYTND